MSVVSLPPAHRSNTDRILSTTSQLLSTADRYNTRYLRRPNGYKHQHLPLAQYSTMMTIVEHRILLPTIEETGNAVISDVEAACLKKEIGDQTTRSPITVADMTEDRNNTEHEVVLIDTEHMTIPMIPMTL